tara:strand:+ start:276 stop:536 length:261 start_codon:yes stop_codon:yes gene_type:complete
LPSSPPPPPPPLLLLLLLRRLPLLAIAAVLADSGATIADPVGVGGVGTVASALSRPVARSRRNAADAEIRLCLRCGGEREREKMNA